MAAPRLPFLWPVLFRQPKTTQPRTAISGTKPLTPAERPHPTSRRQFSTSPRRAEVRPQRYGKALEPAPHLREQEAAKEAANQAAKEAANQAAKEAEQKKDTEKSAQQESKERGGSNEAAAKDDNAKATPPNVPQPPPSSQSKETTEPPPPPPEPPSPNDTKPLDSVLYMPGSQETEAHKPPHLKTPPYVHHFDTYGLVRELTRNSAYTNSQSITIMKGVRQMLLDNMELAREGLVSKSNVENQTYLFRAACSELKNEIGNSRKTEIERMRTERSQLQHEVDILGQKLGQEMSGLRDELKGLFDDRKMAVRHEQRNMQTKIQELGYKITIALNSESRSEVEGLRWVLTRRAAITLGISAFFLFVGLRYISYQQHQLQQEEKRGKEEAKLHKASSPMEDLAEGPKADVAGEQVLAVEGVNLG